VITKPSPSALKPETERQDLAKALFSGIETSSLSTNVVPQVVVWYFCVDNI